MAGSSRQSTSSNCPPSRSFPVSDSDSDDEPEPKSVPQLGRGRGRGRLSNFFGNRIGIMSSQQSQASVVSLDRVRGRGRGRVTITSSTGLGISSSSQVDNQPGPSREMFEEQYSASELSADSVSRSPPEGESTNNQPTENPSEINYCGFDPTKTPEGFDLDALEVIVPRGMPKVEIRKERSNKRWVIPKLPTLLDDFYAERLARIAAASNNASGNACSEGTAVTLADFAFPQTEQRFGYNIPDNPWQAILHGDSLMRPYNDIKYFPLYNEIKIGLKPLRIDQINSLQRCTWPHVFRGRNCFIVGGYSPQQGKTLAYLVPIAAKMMKDSPVICKMRSLHHGPFTIILCSSLQSSMKIERQLESFTQPEGLTIYRATKSDIQYKSRLGANPDIIICKPDFILFVMEECSHFFSFSRLRYFIVDDSHLLLEDQFNQTSRVFQSLNHELEMTKERTVPLQFIFCGQAWSETLKDLCTGTLFNDPVLIIGSFFEALAYGNVKLHVDVANLEEKCDAITKLVLSVPRGVAKSFLIICNTRQAVVYLAEVLRKAVGFTPTYIDTEYCPADFLSSIRREWNDHFNKMSITIFIVTDQDLRDLGFKGATTIIHFDMPEEKLDAFAERHVGMWSLFQDIIKVETDELNAKRAKLEFKSYVFIDPEDPDLHKIIHHLQRLDAEISPELEKIAQDKISEDLKTANMCMGINLFGKCNATDKKRCQRTNRHVFTSEILATEPTVPGFLDGRVEVQILKCFDVNYFQVKVLNFYQVREKMKFGNIPYMNMLKRRNDRLSKYYEEEANRIPLLHPQQQTLCAIKFDSEQGEYYTRAKIVDTIELEGSGYPRHFRVWCVDIGEYKIRSPDDVFELPDEFKNLCQLIASLIIANMKPVGDEEEFRSNKIGWKYNAKDILKDKILTGNVCLAVEDMIWVKSLYECHKTRDGDWVQLMNVRTEFLTKRHVAEDNPEHLDILYKLCEDQGFDCSKYRSVEVVGDEFHRYMDHFNLGWLPVCQSTTQPFTLSMISTFVASPDRIYGIQEKFEEMLDDLVADLKEEVEALIKFEHRNYHEKFLSFYKKGIIVAAKDWDGLWQRALILDVIDEKNQKPMVNIFYVDQGDSRENVELSYIFPLPKQFVLRLPFQVVCMRLNHVKPTAAGDVDNCESWSESANDYVMDQLVKDGRAVKFDVVPLRKIDHDYAYGPYCNYYDVFILGEKEMGEGLVDKKLAEYKPGGLEDYETVKETLLEELNRKMDEMGKMEMEEGLEEDSSDEHDEENRVIDLKNLKTPGTEEEKDYLVHLGDNPEMLAQLMQDMGFQTRLIPKASDSQPEATLNAQVPSTSLAEEETPGPDSVPGSSDGTANKNKSENTKTNAACNENTVKTPIVKWSQTKADLTLTVCLEDVKQFEFKVEESKNLHFKSIEPPDYSFTITTSFKVVADSVREIPLGQHLIIKVNKLTRAKWTSIQKSNTKIWWLKKDLEKVSSGSSSDDEGLDENETHYFGRDKRRAPAGPATDEFDEPPHIDLDQYQFEERSDSAHSETDEDVELSELEDMA